MPCYQPIMLKSREALVPCGKCEGCKKSRTSAWSFRLMQEEKVSETAYFLTLTYASETVPTTKNKFMDLSKRDIQLFFKRLRKSHSRDSISDGRTIKYYCAGEYGGKSFRPHYHIILFNGDLQLMFSKSDIRVLEYSNYDGTMPVNCLAWPHGHATLGKVSEASVGYTLKYIVKSKRIPMHRNDDRTPEFSLMSKGLGLNYLTEEMLEWHLADMENRMYCNLKDGKKCTMPRYYKDKIYWPLERTQIARAAEKKIQEKQLKELSNEKPYDKQAKKEAIQASFVRMNKKADSLSNNKI